MIRKTTLASAALLLAALLACKSSKPAAGGSCSEEGDNECENATTHLACKGGKWVAYGCKGPKGCEVTGDVVSCDATVAEANAPCDDPGNGACTVDKQGYLECKDGKWLLVSDCLGPKACSVTDEGASYKVNCDETLAKIGGACDTSGDIACSVDKKAQLKCSNSKWEKEEDCAKGCTVETKGDDITLGCVPEAEAE